MSIAEGTENHWMTECFGVYRDDAVTLEERRASYRDMIGYVPPRVAARLAVTGALDPEALRLQEQFRTHAIGNAVFDEKTTQLLIFGMMMAELSDAAIMHAHAARRAGASWEELQAIVTLCTVFRGIPAANRGAEILAKTAEKEWMQANEAHSAG